ncbi:hypothetical protein MNBD_NITROSPINAE04-2534, partial [hydrothermal vent metagenome]
TSREMMHFKYLIVSNIEYKIGMTQLKFYAMNQPHFPFLFLKSAINQRKLNG